MFSNLTVGFLLGAGFGAWVYSKMMHSTGNNNQTSLLVGGMSGVFAMVLTMILLGIFF